MRNLIIRIKIKYWATKLWFLRKVGLVYDFERGLTKPAPDASPSASQSDKLQGSRR